MPLSKNNGATNTHGIWYFVRSHQVTAGTIFDEILVTDSLEEAQKFAEDTWAAKKDKEKEAHEDLKKKQKEEGEVSCLAASYHMHSTTISRFVYSAISPFVALVHVLSLGGS